MEGKVKKDLENNKKKTNDKGKTGDIDYDELLSSAGEFGKFQIFLFFVSFPFYIFGSFSYFSQVFITETAPNHWCMIPELQNLTVIERKSLAIPLEEDSPFGYSRCEQYDANWTEILTSGVTPKISKKKVPCKNGWEFNTTEFAYPTIGSEMGWVCNSDSNQAAAQSIFFVGSIAGGLLVGWISDQYGRLPASVFSNLLGGIGGTATAFVTSFTQFSLSRFLVGMSYDNCMMMTYLIILEYVAPKYRTIMANLSFAVFFTIGAVSLPWIALVCAHWKMIALATSLPMMLSLLAPFFVPESPRWLLSKGRVDDAVNKVIAIARVNKKEVPQHLIDEFKSSTLNRNEVTGNILEMLRRPVLRKIFIITCLEYTFAMIIFDSLIRTIGQLKFDFYLSFSVISLTEFPSLVLLSFILDHTGRKLMMLGTMTICGIFSFVIPFLGGGLGSVMCAVVARFMINMACNTAMQWTAEMLPTSARGAGSSIAHICGYVGSVIAPFVAYLEVYQYWLPMAIVGTLAISGALLSTLLPETAQKDMPQTFDEAEDLIISQPFELPFVKNTVHSRVNESFELN